MTTNKPFRIQEDVNGYKATVTLSENAESYLVEWDHWKESPDYDHVILPNDVVNNCLDHGRWQVIDADDVGKDTHTCLLQQIKDFTDNYTAEVTIHNGIYQILDADTGDVYRANDDESLVKIMNSMKLLADAVVEDGE